MKRRNFYWLVVVNSWLKCLSTVSRLVKADGLLCRPQGMRVLGSTPTWICLLIYPNLTVAHCTISITFVISEAPLKGAYSTAGSCLHHKSIRLL